MENKVRVARLNAELKVVKAEMLLELPVATTEQFAAIQLATREVTIDLPTAQIASQLNKEFRLNEHQREQLSADKAVHAAHINTDDVKLNASQQVLVATLKTYKLKAMKNGGVSLSITGTIGAK